MYTRCLQFKFTLMEVKNVERELKFGVVRLRPPQDSSPIFHCCPFTEDGEEMDRTVKRTV